MNSAAVNDDDKKPHVVWLSRGLETLESEPCREPFDVVIVGSGYGGAVTAAELAGTKYLDGKVLSVCLLERGNEYLSGMFPTRFADIAGHVRFSGPKARTPRGRRTGLFDMRIGPDLCALVANGLGGGSLINGGVMEKPKPDVFDGWPIRWEELESCMDDMRVALGSATRDQQGVLVDNTIASQKGRTPPPKYEALAALARPGTSIDKAAITVAMRAAPNAQNIWREECVRCGDCVAGCNYEAKNSLDVSLLAKARGRGTDPGDVQIVTGATVLRLARVDGMWLLSVVYTDEKMRAKQGQPMRIRARHVVLSAGTFGSTEILLRSQSDTLRFSRMLGRRFSMNGDAIVAAYATNHKVRISASQDERPDERNIGPTITGILRHAGTSKKDRFTIEELAIPSPLRRVFEEIVTTTAALHALPDADESVHRPAAGAPADEQPDGRRGSPSEPVRDPLAVDPDRIDHTMFFGLMGHDESAGQLELIGSPREERDGDGAIRVTWPSLRVNSQAPFDAQVRAIRSLYEIGAFSGATSGRPRAEHVMPNPMWRPLPESMDFLVKGQRGPLLSIHPLGGCVMGSEALHGVVDHQGQVFFSASEPGCDPADVLTADGTLRVLDGSIIPTSLGTNPSLTIAAVALRAARLFRAALEAAPARASSRAPAVATSAAPSVAAMPVPPAASSPEPAASAPARRRRWFREMKSDVPPDPRTLTQIQVVERLTGPIELRLPDGTWCPRIVELTLRSAQRTLHDLSSTMGCQLQVKGRLRVFAVPPPIEKGGHARREHWSAYRELADLEADYVGTVSGTVILFDREASTACRRRRRALVAWWLNRGARDAWQQRHRQPGDESLCDRAKDAHRLASRAGEARTFSYLLDLVDDPRPSGKSRASHDPLSIKVRELFSSKSRKGHIEGEKRLTYSRRGNPWRQLSELTVTSLCGIAVRASKGGRFAVPVLPLDTIYLTREGVPLVRVTEQENQPDTLMDLASYGLYLFRILLHIHVWSARAPDPPEPRIATPLPDVIPGVIPPKKLDIQVDVRRGKPVNIRLTRYEKDPDPARARRGGLRHDQPPVLMTHGYSAGSVLFTHASLRPSLAGYLWEKGYDVWVLDMRSSCGLPTGIDPWKFEEMAQIDIPVAIAEVRRMTGAKHVDFFGHCMGAAMFSMAALSNGKDDPRQPFAAERATFGASVRRAVFSQGAPLMRFCPANTFNGYVMGYIRHIFGVGRYAMHRNSIPGLGEQLYDRLLATYPYPEAEFDLENPCFWKTTPFTATRRRGDAVFGREMQLANVSRHVLLNIDDLMGDFNLETAAQTIFFSEYGVITDAEGCNRFFSTKDLKEGFQHIPLMHLMGLENGLINKETADYLRGAFHVAFLGDEACKRLDECPLPGIGHLDLLIGEKRSIPAFARVHEFLTRPDSNFARKTDGHP